MLSVKVSQSRFFDIIYGELTREALELFKETEKNIFFFGPSDLKKKSLLSSFYAV